MTAPSKATSTPAPLDGVRILDLTRMLPGPFCTQLLGDFGAEIIKVEDVDSGDPFRQTEPKVGGVAMRHLTLNRNKKSLAIDLKSGEGREAFSRLADGAHAIVEQFRPGVMDRLGLGYDELRRRNPALVYCSLSGFGQTGPWRNVAAHDSNYLALAGVLDLIGAQGGAPAMSGLTIADMLGALLAATGVLTALRGAEKSGIGDYIDVSMFDGSLAAAVTALSSYLGSGSAPTRGRERHTGGAPVSGVYETADGRHIAICAIEPAFWARLCQALDREDWIPHAFASGTLCVEIQREMGEIFRRRTRDEWSARLGPANACATPVLSIAEAVESEHARAREIIVQHRHETAGETRLIANPIRFRGFHATIRDGAPALGQHSEELLKAVGYSDEDLSAMKLHGTVRFGAGAVEANFDPERRSHDRE